MEMKKKGRIFLIIGTILLAIFVCFTICVKFVDVSDIGPNGSLVGFSHINKFFHNLTGVHFSLYKITDFAEIVAILPAIFFAFVGFVQLLKRKNLFKVDKNILALGVFYIATIFIYLLFEFVVINRRPVLIDEKLESSYPSSTTILAVTFLLSLLFQIDCYIKNKPLSISLKIFCITYCAFLVVVRLVCGVHWLTDIVAGLIVSSSLLFFYYGALLSLPNPPNK